MEPKTKQLVSDPVSLQKTQSRDHVYMVTGKQAGPSLSPSPLPPSLPQPCLEAKKPSQEEGTVFNFMEQ